MVQRNRFRMKIRWISVILKYIKESMRSLRMKRKFLQRNQSEVDNSLNGDLRSYQIVQWRCSNGNSKERIVQLRSCSSEKERVSFLVMKTLTSMREFRRQFKIIQTLCSFWNSARVKSFISLVKLGMERVLWWYIGYEDVNLVVSWCWIGFVENEWMRCKGVCSPKVWGSSQQLVHNYH